LRPWTAGRNDIAGSRRGSPADAGSRQLAVGSRQSAVGSLEFEACRLAGLQNPSPGLRPPSPRGEGFLSALLPERAEDGVSLRTPTITMGCVVFAELGPTADLVAPWRDSGRYGEAVQRRNGPRESMMFSGSMNGSCRWRASTCRIGSG